MSTAARKTPDKPIEPEVLTPNMETARFETAIETMMEYVGYLTNQVIEEENSPNPNQAKIEALREQKQALMAERKALYFGNEKLIAKAIYVYAPIMKALYGKKLPA